MDNNQITITLPKQLWDDVNVELEAQKERLKELYSLKKEQFMVIDNVGVTYRNATINLPLVKVVENTEIKTWLNNELKGTEEVFDEFKALAESENKRLNLDNDALSGKIKNYNELPWWRKIFVFNL